jgi:transketolase
MALSGLRPYGATFFVFTDYMRPSIRLSAIMYQPVIYVLTHDSIGLGEDGPTHQPVEHAASLRLIPNLDLWRPCDTLETAAAWMAAIERKTGPTALLLTRQNVPFVKRDQQALANVRRGGYVLKNGNDAPRAVIIATGSEVALALGAQERLAAEGVPVRVVSMPSTGTFDRQEETYRSEVLPRGVPRVAVEAGVSDLWRKYVGTEGAVVGLDRFGESAPGDQVFKHFGFTADHVAAAVKRIL